MLKSLKQSKCTLEKKMQKASHQESQSKRRIITSTECVMYTSIL